MLEMKAELLPDYAFRSTVSPYFRAVTNAHGVYNTQQFVLRLSPEVHRILAENGSGVRTVGDVGYEGARAMSTLLHETVHWWQHIGSTFGFIYNLVYPVQSHCTHFDLKRLVAQDGFKKSVLLQSLLLAGKGPGGFGTVAGLANTIVNNHFDLLAFRAFTYGPKAAIGISQQKLFEAVGHSFRMTYSHIVNTLGSTVDRDFIAIPHPKEWEEGFRDLRDRRVNGYFYGSRVEIWPLGALEIFEGQACFSQIQYLSHGCGHRLDWDAYRTLGLIHGVYEEAFKRFLELTESAWPDRVDDPLVGLFLLVCDLSLNPGSGFPFHVKPNFETFIEDVNPGARFSFFCRMIKSRFPSMKTAVRQHSRDEYETLSNDLCASIKEIPPLLIAQRFSHWFSRDGVLSGLREEYRSYQFRPENYPLRHLFAHFLAFQEDKYLYPEFFCWPGAWMAGDLVHERSERLFNKHGALFVDKEDDDGVFPRIQEGRDLAIVHAAFDKFYHDSITYDFTDQWISRPGPFRYDLRWIIPEASDEEVRAHLKRQFSAAYGLDPDDAHILPSQSAA